MRQPHLPDPDDNPCTRCGACCQHFRVSFYWVEAAVRGLPEDLYEPVTPLVACMKGTQGCRPRCTALRGKVGQSVTCIVYEHRTSSCRDLQPGDDKCQRARLAHGLPRLNAPATSH